MTDSKIPTEGLYVQDPEKANEEIIAFAAELEAKGERAWFEIRYPAPPALSPKEQEEWLRKQEDVYDAVEVIDGEIHTLPPYAELRGDA